MPLKYFEPNDETADVVAALRRDGAAVVTNQVAPDDADAVLAELRTPFDEVGKFDESDFNGYTTLRVSGILAVSPTSADLVAHPRVLEVADAILLEHCLNYRIGSLTAIEIHRQVRAFDPWPGTSTTWRGKNLKILSVLIGPETPLLPGEVRRHSGALYIGTGSGQLEVHELQIEGKSRMSAAAFIRGYPDIEGATLNA